MLNDGIGEHFVVQRGADVNLLRQKRASDQNFIVRVIVRSAQSGVVAVDARHFVFVGAHYTTVPFLTNVAACSRAAS